MDDQRQDPTQHQDAGDESAKGQQSEQRRRFVRGVAAAVPVVLTARSRSVFATGGKGKCLAPSATASIALLNSRPDRKGYVCGGRTPGYWQNCSKTHPWIWKQCGAETTKFSSVFGSGFSGLTLKQVMNLNGGGDPYQLGAHLSAAYLNYKMGWVPFEVMSLQDLKDMWNGRNGNYVPTAGVTWGGEKIVAFLQTTMTL